MGTLLFVNSDPTWKKKEKKEKKSIKQKRHFIKCYFLM